MLNTFAKLPVERDGLVAVSAESRKTCSELLLGETEDRAMVRPVPGRTLEGYGLDVWKSAKTRAQHRIGPEEADYQSHPLC